MGKKLYVGNLTYGVTDSALEQMFAAHGTVESAQVIMDRDTGRSKGFGFVEMKTDQEAQAAGAAAGAAMAAAAAGAISLPLKQLTTKAQRTQRNINDFRLYCLCVL